MDLFGLLLWLAWTSHLHRNVGSGNWAEWATAVIAAVALVGAFISVRHSAAASKAAVESLRENERATAEARRQADIAVQAFEEDAKVRIESQARKVYSVEMDREVDIKNTSAGALNANHIYAEGVLRHEDDLPQYAVHTVTCKFTVFNESDEMVAPVQVGAMWRETQGDLIRKTFAEPIRPGRTFDYYVSLPVPEALPVEDSSNAGLFVVIPVVRFRDAAGKWWERAGYEPVTALEVGAHSIP